MGQGQGSPAKPTAAATPASGTTKPSDASPSHNSGAATSPATQSIGGTIVGGGGGANAVLYTKYSVERVRGVEDFAAGLLSRIVTVVPGPDRSAPTDPEMTVLSAVHVTQPLKLTYNKRYKELLDVAPMHLICGLCQEFLKTNAEKAAERQDVIGLRIRLTESVCVRANHNFQAHTHAVLAFRSAAVPHVNGVSQRVQAARERFEDLKRKFSAVDVWLDEALVVQKQVHDMVLEIHVQREKELAQKRLEQQKAGRR
ncbi:hypothetical protein Pelo_13893 [Pelomyxa schiedti]|nr:hypothetical protein Pelo_13893 [Pelomyxa schiedti]